MAMRYNQPHPGKILRKLCIQQLGLTVTESAKRLGVSRRSLSELLNGRRRISPEMAIRLSFAFGGSAESWISKQAIYDLCKAMQNADEIKSQVTSQNTEHLIKEINNNLKNHSITDDEIDKLFSEKRKKKNLKTVQEIERTANEIFKNNPITKEEIDEFFNGV